MLIPMILSGGSGTRLWPLSREHYPKQFLPTGGRGEHAAGHRAAARTRSRPAAS